MKPALPITPETKVGALLDAYPELEPVLLEMSPEFRKLRNPILRKTVAKLATLAQAARLAKLDARELVLKLREKAGQSRDLDFAYVAESSEPGEAPEWVDPAQVRVNLDADTIFKGEESPLEVVSREARRLDPGSLLRLTSGFRPEPLLEALGKQGYRVFSRRAAAGVFETLVAGPGRG